MPNTVGDAQLSLSVAAASTLAVGLFVLAPGTSPSFRAPVGLEILWFLGAAATVFLGPIAAGLAGYANLVALATRTDGPARQLHLLSLAVVAVFFAGLAFAWWSGALEWLAD